MDINPAFLSRIERALTHAFTTSLGKSMKSMSALDNEHLITLEELRNKLGIRTEASPVIEVPTTTLEDLSASAKAPKY